MQDIQGIGGGTGGGGRFSGGGDRRLRPHNHPIPQTLKCPRCDSVNTKFCYYNNYNLSQPRHFCKSCRRYWTKGGVLRNVPVGGGCRKRSKQKGSGGGSNSKSSSSESSGLTAATPTTAVAEEGSAPSKTTPLYPFSDGSPNLDHQPMWDNQIFMPDIIRFGMADIQTTSYGRVEQRNLPPTTVEELKMQEITGAALDWGRKGDGDDQGIFDLTAAVDPAYWTQPQWNIENDQSLNYLP